MSNEDLQTNWEQDYYNNQKVSDAISKGILSAETGALCEYAQLTDKDGETRLIIITPVTVAGPGPGRKLQVK